MKASPISNKNDSNSFTDNDLNQNNGADTNVISFSDSRKNSNKTSFVCVIDGDDFIERVNFRTDIEKQAILHRIRMWVEFQSQECVSEFKDSFPPLQVRA